MKRPVQLRRGLEALISDIHVISNCTMHEANTKKH